MFEKALVALDLSPAEQPILDCLAPLADWGVHHLQVLHVILVGYAQGGELAHQQAYIDRLEQQVRPIREAGIMVGVQIRPSGEPAKEILAAASDISANLIVVGSRGQNLLQKLFLGRVAREVIRQTTVPVLLEWIEPTAQATQASCEAVCPHTLQHVLLATDFSLKARAAEQALMALAGKAVQVECVHVSGPDATAQETSLAQAAMDELVGKIAAAGIKARGQLLRGSPAEEIARHAAKEQATLIVVGKHGQNHLESMVIGTTAAKLCEMAGRPVLMVP